MQIRKLPSCAVHRRPRTGLCGVLQQTRRSLHTSHNLVIRGALNSLRRIFLHSVSTPPCLGSTPSIRIGNSNHCECLREQRTQSLWQSSQPRRRRQLAISVTSHGPPVYAVSQLPPSESFNPRALGCNGGSARPCHHCQCVNAGPVAVLVVQTHHSVVIRYCGATLLETATCRICH